MILPSNNISLWVVGLIGLMPLLANADAQPVACPSLLTESECVEYQDGRRLGFLARFRRAGNAPGRARIGEEPRQAVGCEAAQMADRVPGGNRVSVRVQAACRGMRLRSASAALRANHFSASSSQSSVRT
jgi:hypothetical protein